MWQRLATSGTYTAIKPLHAYYDSKTRFKRMKERAFDEVAPRLWDTIPLELRCSVYMNIF